MSKYDEVKPFVIMKIIIYMILLSHITQSVFCKDQILLPVSAAGVHGNSTPIGFHPVCPVELFRRKRDVAEYTRWRPKPEPSKEFIVKVFDDDPPKPVVRNDINAVNENKLAFSVEDDSQVYSAGLQPLAGWEDVTVVAESPHRDESPQFLPHLSPPLQQYAPVLPVPPPAITPPPQRDERFKTPLRTGSLDDFEDLRLKGVDKPRESTQRLLLLNDPFETKTANRDESDLRNFLDGTFRKDQQDVKYEQDFVPQLLQRTSTTTERRDLSAGDESYNLFYSDYLNNKANDNEYAEEEGFGVETPTIAKTPHEFPMTTKISVDITESTKRVPPKRTTTERHGIPERRNTNHSRKHCSLLNLMPSGFNRSATLPEIVSKLKQWSESPLAKWMDITNGNMTTMENPIYMMIVDDPSSGQMVSAKETVMVVAGIQGRDHHAVASAMYLLHQLIDRSGLHNDILGKYRFWIIPVYNPDGYEYSTSFPGRREWKKNLRQNWELCTNEDNKLESCISCEKYGLRCFIQPCYGINLDRNFEYQWIPGNELRLEHPCGELYSGSHQVSEVETLALTTYLEQVKMQPTTFIAFKEGGTLGVMYPYSHTKKKRAQDTVHKSRASAAAAAAYHVNSRKYVAGQTSQFLPLYAGGIEDWMDGHLGIEGTYSIMMYRPADRYDLKPVMEHVVQEAFAATQMLLMQKYSESPTAQRVDVVAQPVRIDPNDANRVHPCHILLRAIPALIALARL